MSAAAAYLHEVLWLSIPHVQNTPVVFHGLQHSLFCISIE